MILFLFDQILVAARDILLAIPQWDILWAGGSLFVSCVRGGILAYGDSKVIEAIRGGSGELFWVEACLAWCSSL